MPVRPLPPPSKPYLASDVDIPPPPPGPPPSAGVPAPAPVPAALLSRSLLPSIGVLSALTPPPRRLNVPPLRVDTSASAAARAPPAVSSTNFRGAPDVAFGVPKTPVNSRSLQSTDLHAAVVRNDIAAVRALLGLDGGDVVRPSSAATSSAAAATASSGTPQRGCGAKPAADAASTASAPAALPSCNGQVDVCEEHGWTPLIQAVALPHDSGVPIARILLANGADPAIYDKNGFSTMHWAAACGNAGCIATLHAAGADINVRARRPALRRPGAPLCRSIGETPLHRAARLGAVSCVEKLCELGADIFRPSAFYATALDVAGEFNSRVVPANRASVRKALTQRAPSLATLVLHHDDCLQHLTPHGECWKITVTFHASPAHNLTRSSP